MPILTFPPRSGIQAFAQWLTWVFLCTTGLALGFAVLILLKQIIPDYERVGKVILYALLPGLILGLVQSLFLRSLVPIALWTFATAATFPLVAFALIGAILAGAEPLPWKEQAIELIISTTIFCTPAGFTQWLLLRRRVHHAALWIPASALGWLLTFCFHVYGLVNVLSASPAFILPVLTLAAYGGVTGLALLSFRPKAIVSPHKRQKNLR